MDAEIDAKPDPRDALSGFAAKADDLDEIKKSVNDAASTSGALWLSYLFVLLYTAVSAGSVTPIDLFMQNAVKLPFLSVDLPLKAFFFLAPVLFLFTHVYTLVSFVILSDRAKWYHRELERQIAAAGADDPARAREIQDDLRRHLVSNIFVQFLAGPGDLRQGPFGFVIKLIVWTTLVFAPIAVLLELQIQFLAFHDEFITWTQRVVLLLDVVAVWWLGYRILAGRFTEEQTWARRAAGAAQVGVVVVSVVALIFSFAVATFGDEDIHHAGQPNSPTTQLSEAFPFHDYFFKGDVDSKSRRRKSFFSSTLVLYGFDILDRLKIDDPDKLTSKRVVFSARSRDFRGAYFDLSDLSKVDFEGADLRGASFDLATVREASFYCAKMKDANFNNAHIETAWFHEADLTHATMEGVTGQGARFEGANLTGAKMKGAVLQATTFDGADLTEADLDGANLRGASLAAPRAVNNCDEAESLKKPDVVSVKLEGTNFINADLREASLRDADLTKVRSMDRAKLDSADFTRATVSDAMLSGIKWDSIKRRVSIASLNWGNEIMARSVAIDGVRAEPAGSSRQSLLAHSADAADYSSELADGLRDLVCTGAANASYIARGLVLNQRIATVGDSTPSIVKDMVEDDDCSKALALTSDDKAALVALRRVVVLGEEN